MGIKPMSGVHPLNSLGSGFDDWNLESDGGCNRQVAHPRNHLKIS